MASTGTSKNFLRTLKLAELRPFWLFVFIAVVLFGVNALFLKPTLVWINAVAFIVLGIVVFWSSATSAKSNLETQSSSGRIQSIIANLADGVIAYDNDFKILVFNSAAERIFDVKSSKVVGKNFGPERAKDSEYRMFTQTLFHSLAPVVIQRSEEGAYPQVVDISFEDKELRVSTDRILGPNGQTLGFVKLVQDRTREVGLLRSKSEFISVAAHQLRTPLTAITWIFESMNKIDTIGPKDKELIENGLSAASKLMKIVNDLLDVSKIEEGRFGYNFEEIKITNFMTEILTNAQALARQYNVKVYFEKTEDTGLTLSVDPNRLGMALSNIIDNAIKYNVENGSVTVNLKKLSDKPYVEITVRDTGIGVPPEDLPKIFTKFFRSENVIKRETDGSGLGLYIAKNIIKQHGGNIWLESVLDRGTTVYITLPTDKSLIPPKEIGFDI